MAYKTIAGIMKYIGLSTDDKPTGVPIGSECLEYDTGNTYITHDGGTTWSIKEESGSFFASGGLTTYGQRTAEATTVNGTTWKTLLSVAALTKTEEIWAYTLTVAGGWSGLCKMRIIVDGTKIYPFADEDVENTDFFSGVSKAFPAPVIIPSLSAYIVQFRSSDARDVAGQTCALTELAVISRN